MAEILVVDDDQGVLKATGRILKSHGYEPVLTPSPEEAIRLLKENPKRFSVILLDWKLRSAIDGDMVLKLIKYTLPGFSAPIIFVTDYTGIASKDLIRRGAFDT